MREMQKTVILSDQDIRLKIRRIAHQIHEANLEEDKVFIAGVAKSGYRIACLIKEELEKISGREVKLGELQVNKKDLFAPYKFSFDMEELSGHSVVLVDDVLNSGAVLIYAVRYVSTPEEAYYGGVGGPQPQEVSGKSGLQGPVVVHVAAQPRTGGVCRGRDDTR